MPESTVSVSESRCMRRAAGNEVSVSPTADGPLGPFDRMATLLRDSAWNPTRGQVAWLIKVAYESGYTEGARTTRDELTELNLDLIRAVIDTPPFSAQALAATERQQGRRAAWDAWARQAQVGDHLGGPVAPW